jgi:hypothetical protein
VPLTAGLAWLTWANRRSLAWLLLAGLGLPLLLAMLVIALLGGLAGQLGGGSAPSGTALSDIPPDYLRAYQAAGAAAGLDWVYLAAIGKVETDHGRLRAPGVRAGANAAGAMGPMQFVAGTWVRHGVDGNHDGRRDVYDPADAIPAAAGYLKASGAPGDWDAAIFAYNHASWYVAAVKAWAARYRAAAAPALPGNGGVQELAAGGRWLAPVPGAPGETCDRRIVPDVVLLMRRYRLALTDCFALAGHERDGEHPLGLGADLIAGPGGGWPLVDRLARDLDWREGCAASGCAGQLPAPMRFIGWNGFPDHGDPEHAGANAHLHLSWNHTPASPGQPAEQVWTLIGSQGSG